MRKLLGKDVKVGTKVRCSDGKLARVVHLDTHTTYPIQLACAEDHSTWSVTEKGEAIIGSPSKYLDVIVVFDDTEDTEEEPKELMELRQELERTREELREQRRHSAAISEANLSMVATLLAVS